MRFKPSSGRSNGLVGGLLQVPPCSEGARWLTCCWLRVYTTPCIQIAKTGTFPKPDIAVAGAGSARGGFKLLAVLEEEGDALGL